MKEIRKNSFVALALAFCMTGAMPLSFSAKAEAKAVQNSYDKIKNVIVMIGDGMGQKQIEAGAIYKGEPLYLQSIEQSVYSQTRSADNEITDSAAGGTAIATGVRTNNGYVGINPDGEELTTIMDIALRNGKRTGIVTTDVLYGATPIRVIIKIFLLVLMMQFWGKRIW